MEKLSIYSCKIIIAVLKTNSFTKAGRLLNLTPSAVSHTIKKNEIELGYQFFYRYKNGVFITESGKLLLPYINSVIDASRILDDEILRVGNNEYDTVKLGTFFSATTYWIPDILTTFNAKHPNITVRLFQSGDSQIIDWIENHDIDLAILSTDTLKKTVPFTPLHKSPLVCLAHKDYSPNDGKHMTPNDIENTNLIMQYEGFDTEIISYLNKNDLSTKSNILVESDHAGFALVRAGLGCYLSPIMAVGDNILGLNIYPLVPTVYRNIGIVAVSPDNMSPATQLLENHIISYLDNMVKNV